MVYNFDGYNYIIRLDKGERLMESLQKFAAEAELQGAWINGLGGALALTLGFYNLDKKTYQWQTFEGLYEVVSLTGNMAFDEQNTLVVHLHGAFGDKNYQTLSGHVKDLTVGGTLELFLHHFYKPLKRKIDPVVGLPTLDLESDQ